MTDRPNILFFFTDDQRFDALGALGTPEIKTPNLDRLAKQGTVFSRAHIPGGTCGAVCMPSRAMLHTGRSLFHIEGEGQSIRPEHTTMGELFRSQGYETFGTGKWHNGRDSFARSFSSGDEIFFGGMEDHWNVPAYRFDPSGRYDMKRPYIPAPKAGKHLVYRYCDHIEAGKHSTDLFTDAAAVFLDDQDQDRPFFMYVSLMAPHDPRTMPEKYLEMYNPEEIPLPDNFLTEHPIDTGALRIRDEVLAAFPRNPDEIKQHIAEYYAMISHIDNAFGMLVQKFEAAGVADNTIIVFAGDNGLALGQHGLMGKQNVYEHSVRVPLIMKGPGIPAGQDCQTLCYLIDIFPTLCEITGINVPESVEGESLVPCLDRPQTSIRDDLYLAYADSIRGVSTGELKLIEYDCGETQLFDLRNDPWEKDNLAKENSVTETVIVMRKKLTRLASEWNDTDHPTGRDFWSCRTDLA